ncbi:MAG: molybdopterin-synthase adenylyltransferase MoeB [Oligoflexus sp.]
MSSIQKYMEQLKRDFPEVPPQEAIQYLEDHTAIFIDVREQEEVDAGMIPQAEHIPRGFLELKIESLVPNKEQAIIVHCASGMRSLLAARDLATLGYQNVASLQGGFNRWKAEALPIIMPKRLNATQRERYLRHLRIPELGEKGQLRLLESKVLLVGAGGLGCPAAIYLAAAGIGEIGIIDPDIVDRSNLQRQVLHSEATIGLPKVESAKKSLLALNPDIKINCYQERLSAANAEALIREYDLVIDGTDNFTARYLVNDACVKLGKPNVHGSIYRFEGQVSVFWPQSPQKKGPCYRCLFPEPPPAESAPSCAEAGVLGILPGVIGTLEAVEAIKILAQIGEPLVGRILSYDALAASFQEIRLPPDPACVLCQGDRQAIVLEEINEYCRG